jgi:hypothetical protein
VSLSSLVERFWMTANPPVTIIITPSSTRILQLTHLPPVLRRSTEDTLKAALLLNRHITTTTTTLLLIITTMLQEPASQPLSPLPRSLPRYTMSNQFSMRRLSILVTTSGLIYTKRCPRYLSQIRPLTISFATPPNQGPYRFSTGTQLTA